MSDRLTRRRLLALSGTVAATGLAGCTSLDGNGSGPADEGSEGGTDDDGSRDGSGDDENSDTDGSSDEHGSATDQDGSRSGGDINYGPSYVSEIDFHEAGTPDISQTHHEGNRYTRTEFGNGEVIESYYVDGETYEVVDGNCLINDDPAAENSVPDIESPRGVQERLDPTGPTTLDGDSVDVYEHPEEDARWYVSTETGYPVQFEMPVATVIFHSWGDTEPIEPPEGECLEI